MKIALKCEECNITDFVHNLDDFAIIVNKLSPTRLEFINNCFLENRITKKVYNIPWARGKEQIAISHVNSGISNFRVKHYQESYNPRNLI